MGTNRLIGLILLVVGIILLYFGWQSTESLADQVSETVTGRFTDETTWYLIGGAVAIVVGAVLAFKRS